MPGRERAPVRNGCVRAAIAVLTVLAALASGAASGHGAPSAALPATPPATVVSIEFDDGSADQYTTRPLLASRNLHATFFINSGLLSADNDRMTLRQVQGLASDGNEIGGHTVLHQHLLAAASGRDEAMREICDDRANLLHAGFRPTDLAYPFGEFDGTTESLARRCGYNSGRTDTGAASPSVSSDCLGESIPPADSYATRGIESVGSKMSPKDVEAVVTQAQQHGCSWVQILFHHICDRCNVYSMTAADFASLLDWLVAQRSQNITVQTVHEVIGGPVRPAVSGPSPANAAGRNLLRNPSFEQGLNGDGGPACWDALAFGSNTSTFRRTPDAHSGTYAERLDVTSYASGNPELISHQDLGQCAPTVRPGHAYSMGAYYKSTAPARFFVYRRDRIGEWTWWIGPTVPASSAWSHASFATPRVPSGTTAISVGLSLTHTGSLTSDDYSLVDRGTARR
jgi:Polysaccharide deacetylase